MEERPDDRRAQGPNGANQVSRTGRRPLLDRRSGSKIRIRIMPPISRRRFTFEMLPRLARLVAFVILAAASALGQTSKRPNIVLVMADDLGFGDVGYNGNPKVHTPALDQLAKDGVRLDRFYAAPVCSPTRGSCMTGR